MKKTYISPETLVVDIRFDHVLMAGSPQPTNEEAESENGNYTNPLSRTFSFDEDDDDEY